MRTYLAWAILTVGTIGLFPGLANAVEHDGCAGGVDAGNTLQTAVQLNLPVACDGETLAGADPADWYFINVGMNGPTNLNVSVCPTTTKSAGWNPDLEVYFQPLAQLQPILGTFPIVWNALQGNPVLKGSSHNPVGCDTVNAALGPNEIGFEGRWYIREILAGGDGFYHLTL